MRRKWAPCIVLKIMLAACFVLVHAALGEEAGDGKVYTLDESIQYALEHNWTVKEKGERIVESTFAEKEAKSDFLPTFSTTYSYTRINNVNDVPIPGIGSVDIGRIRIEHTVDIGIE